jgi:hypothetical protein
LSPSFWTRFSRWSSPAADALTIHQDDPKTER